MGSQKRDVEKERYWQKIIPEAVRSGMSIREFCRQRRLKESQFYWWQRRLKAGRGEGTQRSPVVHGGAASFALVHRSVSALYYCSAAVDVCVWADARLGTAGLLR
jgi:transposase-like protein